MKICFLHAQGQLRLLTTNKDFDLGHILRLDPPSPTRELQTDQLTKLAIEMTTWSAETILTSIHW